MTSTLSVIDRASLRQNKHPLYNTWKEIRRRGGATSGQKEEDRRSYSSRGVKVCLAWRTSFPTFASDMGPKPTPEHSIDRINNAGGYWCGKCRECIDHGWPFNCRWATLHEQARNRSDNHLITADGVTLILSDWAARLGVMPSAISNRLRAGWSEADAVTVPKGARRQR